MSTSYVAVSFRSRCMRLTGFTQGGNIMLAGIIFQLGKFHTFM